MKKTSEIKTVFANGKILTYEKVKIMGIINSTPDSFYEKSRIKSLNQALKVAEKMLKSGADILDIGGQSTRPGSKPIPLEEEIKRTQPIIKAIKNKFPDCIISIDTYNSKVAQAAIDAGADMINDISAMRFDKKMVEVVKKNNVPVVLMHIKGKPSNMQDNPKYKDVVGEILSYLEERIKFAISQGIAREKLIIDPGIGFGKTVEHNIEILKNISKFKRFKLPVLLGASRKSLIGKILGNIPPQERLEGTLAISCYAAFKGLHIIRVHDVPENLKAVRMIEAICQ